MTPNLNLDCLEHIFQFLSPKDWMSFTKVCKAWKQAAISKEFYTFNYDEYPDTCRDYGEKEALSFKQFIEILQFVAPKIKQTTFERMEHRSNTSVSVLVAFGRFDYALEVNYEERQYLTSVFVNRTERIQKLKLSSFDGATKREWARFFHTNPLKSFKFYTANYRDQSTLYNDYICFLPTNLEQIEFYWPNYYDEEEYAFSYDKILQFLQTHPKLSNLLIGNVLNTAIAKELSKHNETITKLNITYSRFDQCEIVQTILESINVPSFTKLKKLYLTGFKLDDQLCKQIAQNCENVRCLKISTSEISEKGLQSLMSLPNLTELHMHPIKIKLNTKVTSLEKLVYIINRSQEVDYENLAMALTLMPNLTSLAFISWEYRKEALLSEKSLLKIQRPVHSRGQNVVLYTSDAEIKTKTRLREILCDNPSSKKEFSIFISDKIVSED